MLRPKVEVKKPEPRAEESEEMEEVPAEQQQTAPGISPQEALDMARGHLARALEILNAIQ